LDATNEVEKNVQAKTAINTSEITSLYTLGVIGLLVSFALIFFNISTLTGLFVWLVTLIIIMAYDGNTNIYEGDETIKYITRTEGLYTVLMGLLLGIIAGLYHFKAWYIVLVLWILGISNNRHPLLMLVSTAVGWLTPRIPGLGNPVYNLYLVLGYVLVFVWAIFVDYDLSTSYNISIENIVEAILNFTVMPIVRGMINIAKNILGKVF